MNKLTLPVSVSALIDSIGEKKHFRSSEIIDLIRAANIQAKDLLDWSDFEHDKNEGYGRKLMYKSEFFEIMVMSWAPGDYTAIHNHGYTQWGAVQVFGKLEHSTFKLEEGHYLTSEFKQKLHEMEIVSVNQNLIHQMGNPYEKNVISLHIYGTAREVDGVTDNSQIYEVGKGEIQIVDGGVFYDLPKSGMAVANVELLSDRLTLIGHYTQLLNFYCKSGNRGPQYRRAVNFFHDRSFESRLITELEMDSKAILYLIELKKAQNLLKLLSESTSVIDSILRDICDPDSLS